MVRVDGGLSQAPESPASDYQASRPLEAVCSRSIALDGAIWEIEKARLGRRGAASTKWAQWDAAIGSMRALVEIRQPIGCKGSSRSIGMDPFDV